MVWSMTPPPDGRGRGRPPATSAAELERIATALFIEHGYDEVSVDGIAAAAGISRATFFRYFATKGEVVWASFDRALDRLEAALADVPDEVETLAAVRAAILASIEGDDYDSSVWWERSTMMNTVPALLGEAHVRWKRWTDLICAFVADRMRVPATDPIPAAVAWAYFGLYLSTLRAALATPTDADAVLEHTLAAADTLGAQLSTLVQPRD